MLQEKNINIGLVKPLLKTFPVSGESPAALSYLSIEEYPLHTQLHMELIYVAEGSISVKVGVSNYILHAGEFTIINPFELHALYAADEPNRVCILEINRDFYDPCEEENIFVSAYSLYKDASGKDFVQIKNLLNKIFALHLLSRSGENPDVLHLPAGVAENDVQYEKILLRSLINYFELHFTHEYFLLSDDKENSLRDRAQQANRLKSILLYFYENFPQKIQLQDVADVTFINRYYISHLVKSGVGLTFSELLQHIRVEKSEIYLLGTQMPVSQIVYELGFSSYRYFSVHFKRLFDMTPAAYRKKFARHTIRYKNVTAARSTTPADIDRVLAMFSKEHIARADAKDRASEDAESIALKDAESMAQADAGCVASADGENIVQAEAADGEECGRVDAESIARAACESIAPTDVAKRKSHNQGAVLDGCRAGDVDERDFPAERLQAEAADRNFFSKNFSAACAACPVENARVVLLKSLLEKGGGQKDFEAGALGHRENGRAFGVTVGAASCTVQTIAFADKIAADDETALPQRAVLYDTPFFPAVLLSRMASGVMGDTASGMTGGGICGISLLHEYGRFFEEETAVDAAIKDRGMNCGFDLGGGVVFAGEPGSIAKCGLRKSVFYLKEMLRPFLQPDMRFADSAIILPGIFLIKQQKTIEILLYNDPICADAGAGGTTGITDAGTGETADAASAGGFAGSADTGVGKITDFAGAGETVEFSSVGADKLVRFSDAGAGEITAPLPLARLLEAKEPHDFYSLAKNCRDQCWHLDLSGFADTNRILIKKSELKFETDAFLQWERMGRPPSIDEKTAVALNNASAPDSYFESYELPGESGGLYPVTLKPFHVQQISLFLQ